MHFLPLRFESRSLSALHPSAITGSRFVVFTVLYPACRSWSTSSSSPGTRSVRSQHRADGIRRQNAVGAIQATILFCSRLTAVFAVGANRKTGSIDCNFDSAALIGDNGRYRDKT